VLLILSIILVVSCIYLYTTVDDSTRSKVHDPTFYRLIAILGGFFFSLGLPVSIRLLIKSRLMLVIDHKGINFKPTNPSTEILPWNDMLSFQKTKIRSTKILIIHVKEPYSYLEKEQNILKGTLVAFNIEKTKSPFNIGVSSMNIGFDDLEELLNRFLTKYGAEN